MSAEEEVEAKFEKLYNFEDGAEVVIKHMSKNHLRIEKDNDVNWKGGVGQWARWKVHINPEKTQIQFESLKSGKFLRCQAGKQKFEAKGALDGTHAKLSLDIISDGLAIIKTHEQMENGSFKVLGYNDDKAMPLQIFMKGVNSEFRTPYTFDAEHRGVMIQHCGLKHIKVKGEKKDALENNGGFGDSARFRVFILEDGVVRIKSMKNKDHIRIKKDGKTVDCGGGDGKMTQFKVIKAFPENEIFNNVVYLESVEVEGTYLTANDKAIACSKQKTDAARLTFFKE